jgi:hypothetical protein
MPYYGGWYPRPSRGVDPGLRVGDAERNQVAEALSQHYTDGRLDANELKERLDQAMGAKTRGDLTGLLTDLPPLAPPSAPPPSRRRRAAMWGALVLFLLVVTTPWAAYHWMWFPRIPWIVIGVVGYLLWRGSGRRHRRVSP